MTSEEAVQQHKDCLKKEATAWKNWQIMEAELKEAMARIILRTEGTVPEKEAKVILDPQVKQAKDKARYAQFQHKNKLGESQAAYEIFLVLHQESKDPNIIDRHGN